MSKSVSFTLVLTVICLSVLMSLEADAQSTTDETNSCSSSSLEEVVNLVHGIASVQQEIKEKQEENARKMEMWALKQQENANDIKDIKELIGGNSSVIRVIASNQQENTEMITGMKELLVSNSSALQEVVNLVKIISSNQKKNAKEIKKIASVQQEIKEQLAGNSSVLENIANEIKRIASNQEEIAKQMNASKSCESETVFPSKQALVSALVSEFVSFHSTDIHYSRPKYCPKLNLSCGTISTKTDLQ